jgi:hypothetical protein
MASPWRRGAAPVGGTVHRRACDLLMTCLLDGTRQWPPTCWPTTTRGHHRALLRWASRGLRPSSAPGLLQGARRRAFGPPAGAAGGSFAAGGGTGPVELADAWVGAEILAIFEVPVMAADDARSDRL